MANFAQISPEIEGAVYPVPQYEEGQEGAPARNNDQDYRIEHARHGVLEPQFQYAVRAAPLAGREIHPLMKILIDGATRVRNAVAFFIAFVATAIVYLTAVAFSGTIILWRDIWTAKNGEDDVIFFDLFNQAFNFLKSPAKNIELPPANVPDRGEEEAPAQDLLPADFQRVRLLPADNIWLQFFQQFAQANDVEGQ